VHNMCRYELPADFSEDKELKLIPIYMRLDRWKPHTCVFIGWWIFCLMVCKLGLWKLTI